MTRQATTTRTLSTAEEQRENVLRTAVSVIAERGLYGTPTTEVARAAGISQAYLFRLFPTKTELFVAVLERSNELVHDALLEAAREARRTGGDVRMAMAEAYTNLLRDSEVLLMQLQGQAAASEPAVRDSLRACFARLVAMVEHEWEATPEEIQAFFARGMLCNVIAAMQIDELDEPWAKVLAHADGEKR